METTQEKLLKTSGFVEFALSMEIMASTQEMKLKQDPELISLDNSIQTPTPNQLLPNQNP